MPFDPYGEDPFRRIRGNRSALAGDTYPSGLPRLTPDQEDQQITSLAGSTLNALAYVGGFLDKTLGARGLRGLLGGHPRELLSIIPGSDTIPIPGLGLLTGKGFFDTLSDKSQQVGGRDLLENAGILDKNTPGLDWGDVAGFGTEVLLNPGNLLLGPGAALTQSGRAAKMAGVLPKTLAGRIGGTLEGLVAADAGLAAPLAEKASKLGTSIGAIGREPLGAFAALKVPFAAEPFAYLGQGKGALEAAEKLGAGWDVVKHATPLRQVRGLFDKTVKNFYDAPGQRIAERASELEQSALGPAINVRHQMLVDLDNAGLAGPENAQMIRDLWEGVPTETARSPAAGLAAPIVARAKALGANMVRTENDLGIPTEAWRGKTFAAESMQGRDPLEYAPRRATGPIAERGSDTGILSGNTAGGSFLVNREPLFDLPGGANAVNRLSVDPIIRQAPSEVAAAAHIRASELGWTAAEEAEHVRLQLLRATPRLSAVEAERLNSLTSRAQYAAHTLSKSDNEELVRLGQLAQQPAFTDADKAALEALGGEYKQSVGLAQKFRSPNYEYYSRAGQGIFGNDVFVDDIGRAQAHVRATTNATAVHENFARNLVHTSDPSVVANPLKYTPAESALEGAGLTHNILDNATGTWRGAKATLVDYANEAGNSAVTLKNLNEWHVPTDLAKPAGRLMTISSAPNAVRPWLDAFDQATNVVKTYLTSMNLRFSGRNLISGVYNNALTVDDVSRLPANAIRAVNLVRGQPIPELLNVPRFAGLSAEEATRRFVAEGVAYRGLNLHSGAQVADLVSQEGRTPQTVQQILGAMPGEQPTTLKSIGQAYKPSGPNRYDPFAVRGSTPLRQWGSGTEPLQQPQFFLSRGGEMLAQSSENVNRLTLLLEKTLAGHSPEEASAIVRAAHVDYSDLSQFERDVMKRLVPFYSFSRRQVGFSLQQLRDKPAGLLGQTLMGESRIVRDQDQFVPRYLSHGLTVPAGEGREPGTARFLTTLGLPVESGPDAITIGTGGLAQSMMGVLGQLHPFIKAPLEYATGKQFYSGRNLADVYGPTGSTLIDQIIMNSPAQPFYTTQRTLRDPRKGVAQKALNTLTGVKISDVDMDRQRDIAAADEIRKRLAGRQGIGSFETMYQKPGAELTDEERALLSLQYGLSRRARERKAIQ